MPNSSPPVISLRPLREREFDEPTRSTAVGQIEASLKNFGCVCIPVSDLDHFADEEDGETLLRHCYSTAEDFFSMPEIQIPKELENSNGCDEASKAAYTEEQAAREGYGGSCYTPLGKEPAYQEGEKQHVESFSCTRPLNEALCNHVPRGPEFHKSLFPDSQVPGFGAAHSSLWEVLRERVALPMMAALEQMLCLPPDFLLLKSIETSSLNMSLLRTLRYPARENQHPTPTKLQNDDDRKRRRCTRNRVPCAPIDVGISEHTDFEVFTIMHQESPGLHLHTPCRGSSPGWYQLPFRYDTLTVILGDMLELWTSGWLEATRHKVVSPASGEGARRSFVLFQAHDNLVRVHPLGMTQLAAREEVRDSPKNCMHRRGEQHGEQIPRQDSFVEWVQHRPNPPRKKFRPTTQGEWVRKQEFQAKTALERSALG